jgi:hypothetical protein
MLAITLSIHRGRRVGAIRDQYVRYPRFVAEGMTFASLGKRDDVYLRSSAGRWQRLTTGGTSFRAASCGGGVVIAHAVGDRAVIARLEPGSGRPIPISDGPSDDFPACSPDGSVVFFVKRDRGSAIQRCDATGCRRISDIPVVGLAAPPDGDKLAFVTTENRGPMVQWMSTHGGMLHDVTKTETACGPGWSSNRTLWVSRREGKDLIWIEVDIADGRPTWQKVPGSRDCKDGPDDPDSPIDPRVRVMTDRRSQLRFLPIKYLDER